MAVWQGPTDLLWQLEYEGLALRDLRRRLHRFKDHIITGELVRSLGTRTDRLSRDRGLISADALRIDRPSNCSQA
jgi:hypothetical protein